MKVDWMSWHYSILGTLIQHLHLQHNAVYISKYNSFSSAKPFIYDRIKFWLLPTLDSIINSYYWIRLSYSDISFIVLKISVVTKLVPPQKKKISSYTKNDIPIAIKKNSQKFKIVFSFKNVAFPKRFKPCSADHPGYGRTCIMCYNIVHSTETRGTYCFHCV